MSPYDTTGQSKKKQNYLTHPIYPIGGAGASLGTYLPNSLFGIGIGILKVYRYCSAAAAAAAAAMAVFLHVHLLEG